jgi:transglutaminase-like putative cysteine protease
VLAVHRWCGNRLEYRPNETEIGVSIDDLLEGGVGVCQDYAHLAVAMCRSVGIPARYVSGYLFTSNDRTGADVVGDVVSVQTHAWMEAAIPGAGWLALDPTNRLRVGQQHVKIGHGRDYDDVQPLRGVFSGSAEPALEASVEIRRMEPGRQPTTAVQPAVPRPVAAERLRYEQQQQQQQQQ